MMVRPALTTFIHTFCLLELAYAITWSGPQVTPAGLMAMNGVSPRPTQAPDWNGIPRELRKRAAPGQYLYPPPLNWCGFVSGDYGMIGYQYHRTVLNQLGRKCPLLRHRLQLFILWRRCRLLHRSG